MHIKRCKASIYQAYLSWYKELQKIKASKKFLLNDYSQKIISSISRLQDNSSEVVESNIQRNSRGMYSSNTTAIYYTSSFSTICSKSPEINPTTPQKGSIFVNNHLEALSWQLRFAVTTCILINKIDQLKMCISLCAYCWFQ